MAPVHYAVNQRTARLFREYIKEIDRGYDRLPKNSFAWAVSKEIATKGKVKVEAADRVSDGVIDDFIAIHPAHLIIRNDRASKTKRLSTNYEPIISVVGGLYPGKLGFVDSQVDSLQIKMRSIRVDKNSVGVMDTITGVSMNFHAIARLDERDIDKDPIYGLASRINNIMVFATLFNIVCNDEIGRNFAIPYDGHLLLGTSGTMSPPSHIFFTHFSIKERMAKEIGTPDCCPLLEVKTAVSFDELTLAQDELHDALIEFVTENIDDINLLFENYNAGMFVPHSLEECLQAKSNLTSKFKRIARMTAWIKNQQR